jgi:outer membrane lipoprotein-sorting protein
MLLGCASSQKPQLKETTKRVVFREYTLKDLRDDLAGRQKLIRTMAGNVTAELESRVVPGGRQSMSGTFGFEMPDKVRMSLGKAMTSFQVDLISDGDRYWLVNHAAKTVQTGKCENIVGVENEKISIRPMDLVDAYFLREITDQPGFTKRITFLETVGQYYIISVLRDDFSNLLYSKVWVDRFSANVVRHQLYDADKGTIRVDAILEAYENVAEVSVPHRMTISWPNQLATLDIQFKGVRVNPKWDNPKIFVFDSTKPDYAFSDLDQSAKMEQRGGLRERQPGASPVPGYPPQPGAIGFPPAQAPDRPRALPATRPSGQTAPAPQPSTEYVPPPNPYGVKKSKPKPPE